MHNNSALRPDLRIGTYVLADLSCMSIQKKVMPSISTEIIINAPPSVVRNVFLQFNSYSEWNPWITHIDCPLSSAPVGTRIQPIILNAVIDAIVHENSPDRFSWLGGWWLFKGLHIFEFNPFENDNGNGEKLACKFVQREEFIGIPSLLVLVLLRAKTENGFNEMNRALKARVEAVVAKSIS